ncbi:MAG TPA: hypothetical protein VIM65_06670 [Cyclobacteriaceae bacterium]
MEPLPETPEQPIVTPSPILTESKVFEYREKLKLEQRLFPGIAGGAGAAIIGAILWAVITVVTNYQIGYMAVGVGFLVGISVRYFGKGIDPVFGIIGASLALIGCLLGNVLTMLALGAQAENISFIDVLLYANYSLIPDAMMETFSPMDVLFYGIAIYEGYKFSFRVITDEEVLQNS